MASRTLFDALPPFPDNVVTAPIQTISLKELSSGSFDASKSLFEACRDLGFFLLDLGDDVIGEQLVGQIDQLFRISRDIMHLPKEVKIQYAHDPPKSFLGFKPRGIAKTETNQPDRFEWFNLGQDGLIGNESLQPLPPTITEHLPIFASFLRNGQAVAEAINVAIATQLNLPPQTFVSLQDPAKKSGTVVRLIKADASPEPEHLRTSMIHHTDFGSITLLVNVLGGLQILAKSKTPEDPDAWLYVRPQPKCLIVNMGDAMVKWTGGILNSNTHRINFAPGKQRFVERLSLGILFRPERNASMKTLVGESAHDEEDLTAWEWEVKKLMALKR
ncbi:oxidoreductase [Periconia macrospinosa]|uniref:Oxidoreductase n=1 Tax=Periconia macrospinosa TaxID=97972 RepID=A0A2V1DDS3_9PLEO|nr:oxidoreductase [Periconia macrospinosa]